jgi:hypothetical protein
MIGRYSTGLSGTESIALQHGTSATELKYKKLPPEVLGWDYPHIQTSLFELNLGKKQRHAIRIQTLFSKARLATLQIRCQDLKGTNSMTSNAVPAQTLLVR